MSEKITTIKAFTTLGFNRLEMAIKDLKEEPLDWKSCSEANTIRWVLTHLIDELHSFVPKILKGDKDHVPENWPEDYTGKASYSLNNIINDLNDGRDKLMKSLDELTDDYIVEEMDWFWGKRPKEDYLMLAISEIMHHEGQIAAIIGVEKRMKVA